MRANPHDYQKEAIEFGIQRATAGFFLTPGLGKTMIMLFIFLFLWRKKYIRKMLVVAPLRVAHSVWPKEVEKWDQFKDLKLVVLHGKDKDDLLKSDADIYVINPEGLDWLVRAMPARGFMWDMLVVDESTRFKHAQTQQFRTLKPLLPKFKRRYILTGSPAPNGLLDLFGQIFILDLGTKLGPTFRKFRNDYFDPDGLYKWRPKSDAPERIYDTLKPIVLRMDASDLLELPPLVGVDPPLRVEVELDEKARSVYDQMERLLVAQVEDGTVTAANAAAASTKCRQIANGGIYTNQPGEHKAWTHIHNAKAEAVREIIEELQGKPALVAYEYEHDLDRLLSWLGDDVPWIGGGVPTRRFKEIEVAWNEGSIPVLLAQPQSVAHGLNLQGTGAAVIWAGLTWDLEVYEQFYQRVWRQGQKEKIVVHHIVAKDTVDEVILRGVAKKDRSQKALLSALKEYAHERRAA